MFHFTKARRLVHRKQFEYVFSRAKKVTTQEFVILHCKSSANEARIGFALSKKQLPKACQRNRMKRLLRESFRNTSLPPVDIVVLARHGSAEAKSSTISEKLDLAWQKIITCYAE